MDPKSDTDAPADTDGLLRRWQNGQIERAAHGFDRLPDMIDPWIGPVPGGAGAPAHDGAQVQTIPTRQHPAPLSADAPPRQPPRARTAEEQAWVEADIADYVIHKRERFGPAWVWNLPVRPLTGEEAAAQARCVAAHRCVGSDGVYRAPPVSRDARRSTDDDDLIDHPPPSSS